MYDLNNDSSVCFRYEDLLKSIQKNKPGLKGYIPDEYFDIEDEIEYLEKVKEVYSEYYNY